MYYFERYETSQDSSSPFLFYNTLSTAHRPVVAMYWWTLDSTKYETYSTLQDILLQSTLKPHVGS